MKHPFIYTFVILALGLGIYGCDSTTSPDDPLTDHPYISEISVSPQETEFTLEKDGFRDTTLTLDIFIRVAGSSESKVPGYTITNKRNDDIVSEGELEFHDSRRFNYTAKAEITTTTTSFEDYAINAFVSDESGSLNYAQTNFTVRGFASEPPVILEADNPEEVQIPSGDQVVLVSFTAKVTDLDGQDNIDRVLIEFVNEDGSRLVPDPNELLDDGQNSNPNDSGDAVAGDSVYTIRFGIDSSNSPNNRTAQYFAFDKAGLSSDTVETTFNIVE